MPRSAENGAAAGPGDQDAAARGDAPASATPPAAEPYGPLVVKRYRKDDGRALILYSHREPE
jgi:hypothetical protein